MSEQYQFETDPETPRRSKGEDEMFCGSCGEVIKIKATICPNCDVQQRGRVNKTVLLLLTLFLGGFGAHKFYFRKYLYGVFYFFFFWTGMPALVAFFEFIIYAFTSSERLQEKYTRNNSTHAIAALAVLLSITGLFAAIAIPTFTASRNHTYNNRAISDLRMAIWVQEEFHSDYKTYADSIDKLTGDTYGFIISKRVDLTVQFADAERYVMTASHEDGNRIHKTQGPGGEITWERKAEDHTQKTVDRRQ